MSEISDKPLVTFALFAYNQEALIADAMKAALAQDYSPLEIIVSDDCSTDGTWRVIEAIAAGYRGPHELKILRNPSNLGIGPHVSKVGLAARGKLIVVAAGDDISLPRRVSCLVEAWTENGCPEGALHSAVLVKRGDAKDEISKGAGSKPNQATMEYFLNNDFKGLFFGAAAAYTPSLFTRFPPLQASFEDVALTFRALLIGKLLYVDSVLVEYSVHGSNVTRPLRVWDRVRVKRWFDSLYKNILSMEEDYSHFLRVTESPEEPLIVRTLTKVRRKRLRAMGLGTSNPLKILVALFSYPYGVSFRAWFGFYRVFFGVKS